MGLRFCGRLVRAALLAIMSATMLLAACGDEPTPAREVVAVSRPVGSWHGTGNSTIGFLSDSGQFRVTWEARREDPPGMGTFRLAVHSGVSGRPLELIVDHRGEGGGTTQINDDPRLYHLMVESANVEWSVAVEEIVAGYSPGSPESR